MFHVLIVELTEKSLLKWPFRLTGRGFLFSFHKHTEAAFVVQGQGQMPHPGPGDRHPDPINPLITQPTLPSFNLLLLQRVFLPVCVCVFQDLFCLCLMTYKVNEAPPSSPDGIKQNTFQLEHKAFSQPHKHLCRPEACRRFTTTKVNFWVVFFFEDNQHLNHDP